MPRSPRLQLAKRHRDAISAARRGTRCAAQAPISPRSAPPSPGRSIDRATGASCVRRARVAYQRPSPNQGCDNRTNRRRAKSLRRQAGGTAMAHTDTRRHSTESVERALWLKRAQTWRALAITAMAVMCAAPALVVGALLLLEAAVPNSKRCERAGTELT